MSGLNTYFSTKLSNANEQNLTMDLVAESIGIYGQEVYYVPRPTTNEDILLGDIIHSNYTSYHPIAAYLLSADGWEGSREIIGKFGLELQQSCKFQISRKHFATYITPNTALIYPREGDLIYLPLAKTLLVIKYVDFESPFYQLGKNYVYTLSCELFTYSGDQFSTNSPEIDSTETDNQTVYSMVLNAGGSENFVVGESIYIGTNWASAVSKAKVRTWTSGTRTLVIEDIWGNWNTGSVIKSQTNASLSWVIGSRNDVEPANNKYIMNDLFQDLGEDILDLDETNPFGSP